MTIRIKNCFITSGELYDIGACARGIKWFKKNFPKGGKLKSVLEKLWKSRVIGRRPWMCWTIDNFADEPATLPCIRQSCKQCIRTIMEEAEFYEKADKSVDF